jgi:hypothetical protein
MTHLAGGNLNLIKIDFDPEVYARPGTLWKLTRHKYEMFYDSSRLLKIAIWRSKSGIYTVSVHLAGHLSEDTVLKALHPAQVTLAFVQKPHNNIHPSKWVARVHDTPHCYLLLKTVSVYLRKDETLDEIQNVLKDMQIRYGIVETNAKF